MAVLPVTKQLPRTVLRPLVQVQGLVASAAAASLRALRLPWTAATVAGPSSAWAACVWAWEEVSSLVPVVASPLEPLLGAGLQLLLFHAVQPLHT